MSNWDGVDRRNPPIPQGANPPTSEFWGFIIQELHSIKAQGQALHMDLIEQRTTLRHVEGEVDEIKKAFTKDEEGNRDYDGHHDHHDRMIKQAKKWSDIWDDVFKKIFTGTGWFIFIFVCYAIWDRIKNSVNGGGNG